MLEVRLLGRTAPGHVLYLRTQRGCVQTKRARAFASGTGVYVISAWSVQRTGRTGRTRTQDNIFADAKGVGAGDGGCQTLIARGNGRDPHLVTE